MTKKLISATAAVAIAGGLVTATVAGAGDADAATMHGIKLTRSQTAVVAHNGLGNAFSAIPYIPNLVYNPYWGRSIQRRADSAVRSRGCIEVGIVTRAGKSNVDYVIEYPARYCAP